MEAMSKHLEHFSANLFEEIMRFPHDTDSNTGAQEIIKPEASQQYRLEKRRARFVHVKDQVMEHR